MLLNIAYTLTETHYYMTLVSMCSLFENNKPHNINLYVLVDDSISQELIEKTKKSLKKYLVNNKIEFLRVNKTNYNKFSNSFGTLYSLELANLLPDVDKILYINCVSIVNGDLGEVYQTPLENNSCAAPMYIHELGNKLNGKSSFLFNYYALLYNLKIHRLKNYPKTLFSQSFYEQNNITKKTHEELQLLNLLIDDCVEIGQEYGYAERWYSNIKLDCPLEHKNHYKNYLMHIEVPKIIIYFGVRPIQAGCNHSYLSTWWQHAEKCNIYEEIKAFRSANKYKLKSTSAINSFNYSWLLSRMFPYIKPYWFRILIGFAISIPLGLLDGVTALALKPYMDYVVGGKTLEFSILNYNFSINSMLMAFLLPIGIILFAAVQGVLRYLNSYISSWTSRKITNDVKFDLFHKLINMHPQFFDDNSSGLIISRYVNDPSTASSGIVDQLKTITTSLCAAMGLIAVMVYSSWELACIGVLVLCVAFIPVALLRKRIRKASNENMVISGNITTNINETYSGNKVMFAYDLQNRQENLFKDLILQSFSINMSLTKRTAWMSPMMYQIASFGIAIVLGYGTYLINTNQMTAGAFASFVTSLLLLYKPIKTLGGTLTGIQNIFVAMGRIFELFDLDSAIKENENTVNFDNFTKSITFEDVNFEYVPNKPILKNINLTIPKNETIAIVGNSGGGKSTLVNLLPRFYDIKSGSIKIDGIDIKDFSLKSLRKNISMVFQDNFLYSGTIKENILMGKPDATSEELEAALASAHLQKTISDLPEGLDTVIGERGLTLSGGQRQRVAIARAMLRNAPIVILDEATSALDNESESIVQKAMDNLMKNRTVFIIAHRLSTIKNADRIAVINEGELVELGSHDELINIENGHYKALYEMQFKKQAIIK